MNIDPIADYLTRVRNAVKAGHRVVEIPASNVKKEITKILFDQGFVLSYKFEDDKGPQGTIKIALKYDKLTKDPVIKEIKRVSKPGRRVYSRATSIPKVMNGLGLAILSTPKGVMSDAEARKNNVGGEIICRVF